MCPTLLAKEIAKQIINHFNGKKLIGIKDNYQKSYFDKNKEIITNNFYE